MLTERQLLILSLIIEHYIQFKEPVGSRTLLSESQLPFSPATIRNEMNRMEYLGFLLKTHSSSGRVPSIQGYRYYVDNVLALNRDDIPQEIEQLIQHSFNNPYQEVQEVVVKSAEILSSLTNYTVLSLGPEMKSSRLTGFRLVPLNEDLLMAILVTDKGYVENQIFAVPKGMSSADIEKIVHIFNDELIGLTLNEVYAKLKEEVPVIIQRYVKSEIDFLSVFREIISKLENDRLYIGGGMNLLNYLDADMSPEQIKGVYDMIHAENDFYSLLPAVSDDIGIRIGTELNNELLHNFSLITATYRTIGEGRGIIALLGPTNMPYQKIINIMNKMRHHLNDKINDVE